MVNRQYILNTTWFKNTISFITSLYCALLIFGYVTFINFAISYELYISPALLPLSLLIWIGSFLFFRYLSSHKRQNIVLKIFFVAVISLVLFFIFLLIDKHFTYRNNYVNTLFNIFGWNGTIREQVYEDIHFDIGVSIVVYPIFFLVTVLLITLGSIKFRDKTDNQNLPY